MRRYTGTEKGPRGVYLNLSTGEFVQLRDKTGFLPGTKEVNYIKVSSALAMITGPLAGLALIIFLPFVGIVGFAGFLGYRLWRGVIAMERRTLQLGAIGWNPGRAYFIRHGATPDEKAEGEEELNELEKEVTTRRQRGER